MLRENEDSALQDNLSIDYSADMAMVCIPSEVNLKLDLSFCRPKQGQHLKHCLVAWTRDLLNIDLRRENVSKKNLQSI